MIYIILPAYNEEKNLLQIFKKIDVIRRKLYPFKVILIDDCSSDNTQKLEKKKYNYQIIYRRHNPNKGLSITLETGFKLISKIAKKDDIVVTLDSDDTHPVSIIPKMVKKIKLGNDLVIASRFISGSKVNGVTKMRNIMSYGAKILFKIFYPFKNLNDYTCNYRCYNYNLIKEILKDKKFFKNEDFNIAAKILIKIISTKKNLKLKEVPFTLNYQYKIGQSKMNLMRTIFLTLRLIIFKKF